VSSVKKKMEKEDGFWVMGTGGEAQSKRAHGKKAWRLEGWDARKLKAQS
jgi:hypothetical protein